MCLTVIPSRLESIVVPTAIHVSFAVMSGVRFVWGAMEKGIKSWLLNALGHNLAKY